MLFSVYLCTQHQIDEYFEAYTLLARLIEESPLKVRRLSVECIMHVWRHSTSSSSSSTAYSQGNYSPSTIIA